MGGASGLCTREELGTWAPPSAWPSQLRPPPAARCANSALHLPAADLHSGNEGAVQTRPRRGAMGPRHRQPLTGKPHATWPALVSSRRFCFTLSETRPAAPTPPEPGFVLSCWPVPDPVASSETLPGVPWGRSSPPLLPQGLTPSQTGRWPQASIRGPRTPRSQRPRPGDTFVKARALRHASGSSEM